MALVPRRERKRKRTSQAIGFLVYICFLSLSILCGSTTSLPQSVLKENGNMLDDVAWNFHELDDTPHRNRRAADSIFGENIIPENYSIHEPPPKEDGKPSQLNLALLIMNVRNIKEIEEEITLELNMQVFWRDSRLKEFASAIKSKYVVLNSNLLNKIWHPDIFIDNLKSVDQPVIMSKPASLRMYPNSGVRYSGRMTLKMSCQMDFHYYPADTQRCRVDIKSYSYMDTELVLDWKERQGASFVAQLSLPNFFVGMDAPGRFDLRTTSGSYSGLRFTVLLTRKLSYHLIQTYLPSCLLVMVSWLSFLVPPESTPARMAICMTCLLTLIAMFASVRQSTPNVSYVKAIDIWMVVCVFFVFLALAEFCVILKLLSIKRKGKKDAAKDLPMSLQAIDHLYGQGGARGSVASVYYANTGTQQRRLQAPRGSVYSEDTEVLEVPPGSGDGRPQYPLPPTKPAPFQIFTQPPSPEAKPGTLHEKAVRRIELYISIFLPTLFFGFNFVYWPWLMASSQYYAQNHEGTAIIYSASA